MNPPFLQLNPLFRNPGSAPEIQARLTVPYQTVTSVVAIIVHSVLLPSSMQDSLLLTHVCDVLSPVSTATVVAMTNIIRVEIVAADVMYTTISRQIAQF